MKMTDILHGFREGRMDEQEAVRQLEEARCLHLGHTRVDLERECRTGAPEVIFGERKPAEQIAEIMVAVLHASGRTLATRVSSEKAAVLMERFPDARYDAGSRMFAVGEFPEPPGDAYAVVISAGSSDYSVAEEAALTLEFLGSRVRRLYDCGVAGLHRLLDRLDVLRGASAIVAVAGMEGALPSVLAGLVKCPVFAVPTSVGYGASFGGLAALLAMLNSCANGVSVVNIDNGFGGGFNAHLVLCTVQKGADSSS